MFILEGKSKCHIGGKSKRTIQGAQKTTKQVEHMQLFVFVIMFVFLGYEHCIFYFHV